MNRLISLGVLAVVFAVPAVAQADPGNGAQRIQTSDCFTEPGLYTICVEQDILTNATENGNNISIFLHSDNRFTLTGEPGGPYEGCAETSTGTYKDHVLIKKEPGVHESHYRYQNTDVVLNCFGVPSYTCKTINTAHYANGKVQYDRPEAYCEPL